MKIEIFKKTFKYKICYWSALTGLIIIILIKLLAGCANRSKLKTQDDNLLSSNQVVSVTNNVEFDDLQYDSNTYFQSAPTIIIPILCYHRIGENNNNKMNIPINQFRSHLSLIKELGMTPITFDEWEACVLHATNTLPQKPVMITFDDGWRSQYQNALPILNEFGYKATFYVYMSFLNSGNAMNWTQLRELIKQGHTIGSHSYEHSRLNKRLPNESNLGYRNRLQLEIKDSKFELEKRLGVNIKHFCYPYGYYNNEVAKYLSDAGYVSAVTVNVDVNSKDSDAMKLSRFAVEPSITLKQVRDFLTSFPIDNLKINASDGEVYTNNFSQLIIQLDDELNKKITETKMKFAWRWVACKHDKSERKITFDIKKLEPGYHSVQLHLWDNCSNYYIKAWSFEKK